MLKKQKKRSKWLYNYRKQEVKTIVSRAGENSQNGFTTTVNSRKFSGKDTLLLRLSAWQKSYR